MKTSSAKNKGRRHQQTVAKSLGNKYNLSAEEDGHFWSRGMGQGGVDITMSPTARKLCPLDIECKNQEKLNIWSALKQADANTKDGRYGCVVFKRNRSETYIAMKFDDFLELI